jgi:hypothetical protein
MPTYLEEPKVVPAPMRRQVTGAPRPLYVGGYVAGFRELTKRVRLAPPETFVAELRRALVAGRVPLPEHLPPGWDERAQAFEDVLIGVAHGSV